MRLAPSRLDPWNVIDVVEVGMIALGPCVLALFLALVACEQPAPAATAPLGPPSGARVEDPGPVRGVPILQTVQYPNGGGAIYVGEVVPSSTNWTIAQTSETTSFQTGWSDRDHDDHTRWTFRYPSGSTCVKACNDVGAARWATWPRDDAGYMLDTKDALIAEGVECFQRCGLVPEITHGPDWCPPTPTPHAGHVILSAPCTAETNGNRHVTTKPNPDGTIRVWLGSAHLGDFSPILLHGAHVDRCGALVEVLP